MAVGADQKVPTDPYSTVRKVNITKHTWPCSYYSCLCFNRR
jgi:hypothetical protein